jgi:hypothetical protein
MSKKGLRESEREHRGSLMEKYVWYAEAIGLISMAERWSRQAMDKSARA